MIGDLVMVCVVMLIAVSCVSVIGVVALALMCLFRIEKEEWKDENT